MHNFSTFLENVFRTVNSFRFRINRICILYMNRKVYELCYLLLQILIQIRGTAHKSSEESSELTEVPIFAQHCENLMLT